MNSLLSGLTSPMMLNRGFEVTRPMPMLRYPESAYRVTNMLTPTQPPVLAGIGPGAMRSVGEPPQLQPVPPMPADENAFVPLPTFTPPAPNPAAVAASEGQMQQFGPSRLRSLVDRMKQAGNRMTPGIKALGKVRVDRDLLKPVLEEQPLRSQVTSREFVRNDPYRYGRYA